MGFRFSILIACFLATPLSAQLSTAIRPLLEYDLAAAGSPFIGAPLSSLLVEVDAQHPGPEHLVFQLRDPSDATSGVLYLAIHDHPRCHHGGCRMPGPGICAENGQPVNRRVTNWDLVDYNHDGRHDFVRLWDQGPLSNSARYSVFALVGLDACRVH